MPCLKTEELVQKQGDVALHPNSGLCGSLWAALVNPHPVFLYALPRPAQSLPGPTRVQI